ncbi:NADH dehydrogenase subunit 2 (mitochondrion) [Pseudohyphozyma bogoriensis]|nr:NADH dehydrogenase subunit 2 [Pseudohyphozyma bogoriensis]KAI5474124.1 NADH dehydrogenase subunit 2 [Pseudohyphozyma bogoriensis]KAI5474137.1 NADH dehydrogenase subunit 2 [Pseudohyphozyma bogoriensis]
MSRVRYPQHLDQFRATCPIRSCASMGRVSCWQRFDSYLVQLLTPISKVRYISSYVSVHCQLDGHVMLLIALLTLLVAVPLYSSTIPSVQLTRVASLTLFLAAALSLSANYTAVLGSGVGVYSGLFQVSTVSLTMEVFLYVVGGLILLTWASRLVGAPSSYFALPSSVLTPSNAQINADSAAYALPSGSTLYPAVPEYCIIILFTTIGASFLISSADLVSLFLAIELQSFAAYVLATIYRHSESGTAAGLKYFLLGALSSALILLGSSLVYAYSGLTNLDAIAQLLSVAQGTDAAFGVILGLVTLTIGFLFKVSAAPFHNWAPDVYDGVPTIVTSWLAVMPKISIFVLMLSLHSVTEGVVLTVGETTLNVWQALILVSSTLSLLYGTVVGLAQTRIKRLFAYSTISHVGFMLLALAISGSESITAFLFYLVQYSLTSLNSFCILLAFGYLLYSKSASPATWTGKADIERISELGGQFHRNPALALALIVCLFSMAGIPPLVGFFAIVAILASVVSAVYYLRVVRVLYFDQPASYTPGDSEFGAVVTSTHSYIIAALTALILLFGLDPSLILNTAELMGVTLAGY